MGFEPIHVQIVLRDRNNKRAMLDFYLPRDTEVTPLEKKDIGFVLELPCPIDAIELTDERGAGTMAIASEYQRHYMPSAKEKRNVRKRKKAG